MPKGEDGVCIAEAQMALLAGRFRAETLKALESRDIHFNELRRITGASALSLTRQLRALQDAGFITSEREAPWGRNLYRLTPHGRRAVAILEQVAQLQAPNTKEDLLTSSQDDRGSTAVGRLSSVVEQRFRKP